MFLIHLTLYIEPCQLIFPFACRTEFERITEGLSDALDFSHTIGVNSGRDGSSFEQGGGRGAVGEVDFYTSHEGLMLDYEQALTREFPIPGKPPRAAEAPKETAFYNTSAHFIWIGDRTRQIDGAHVEYFRGIRNPIGIKVGPSMDKDELVRLLDSKCPDLPFFDIGELIIID